MKDKNRINTKRKELLDLVIQILKEQFSNMTPNKEKINHYIDEKLLEGTFN